VDTLDDYCERNGLDPKRTYVWICCLCVNQHRVVDSKNSSSSSQSVDFETMFKERVLGIGHVLAMMAPWSAPLYLTRIWCVFELFTANQEDIDVTIVMPRAQKKEMEQALIGAEAKGINALYEALAGTKVQDAEASVEDDRVRILKMIEEGPGYTDLNNRVNELLRGWIAASIHSVVERIEREREDGAGIGDLEYALFCSNVGSLFWHNGELEKGLVMCRKSLDVYYLKLGKNHPDTAKAHSSIGLILCEMGDYGGSLKEHLTAISIRESVLGTNHPDTAASFSNLGFLKQMEGKLVEGLAAHRKALEIRQKKLGLNHVDTANSLNNCGALLYDKALFDDALEKYEQALVIKQTVLGDDHPDVAVLHNNIGRVQLAQGNSDGALASYNVSLAIYESILDKNHPKLATVYYDIGLLLASNGDSDKGLENFIKSMEIRKVALGEDHPATRDCNTQIQTLLDIALDEEASIYNEGDHLDNMSLSSSLNDPNSRPMLGRQYSIAMNKF